ncbi:MAG TPA: hypothetical protein VNG90_00120 [Candidatus Acidoferrum sp.]|nr:hypothetical protein [Candidatus Acidoferrum sp.]
MQYLTFLLSLVSFYVGSVARAVRACFLHVNPALPSVCIWPQEDHIYALPAPVSATPLLLGQPRPTHRPVLYSYPAFFLTASGKLLRLFMPVVASEPILPLWLLRGGKLIWGDLSMHSLEIALPCEMSRAQVVAAQVLIVNYIEDNAMGEISPGFVYMGEDGWWRVGFKGLELNTALSLVGGSDQNGQHWYGLLELANERA